jgi:ankyrin repeat protein
MLRRGGHEAVIKLLLEMEKVDVNWEDKNDRIPLSLAADNGYEVIVKLLLYNISTQLNFVK